MSDIQKIFTLAIGAVSAFFIVKSFVESKSHRKTDSKPRIEKLIFYPIKSLQGVEVDHLEIFEHGVKWNKIFDRALCLLNDKNILLTQRNKPQLSLIQIKVCDGQIILDAPGMDQLLQIDYHDDVACQSNELITFEIWGQETQGYFYGEHIQQWFTKYLGSGTKMVRFVDGLKQCHPIVMDKMIEETTTYYQDLFPILMINQSSIDELNQRMNGRYVATYRNFRPNFLIADAHPWEEDEWKIIRINEINYDSKKPCDRCLMTTVDPYQGVKHPDMEPIRTLRTYRIDKKWNEKAPLFGINLIPLNSGTVRVGDYLEILDYQSSDYIQLQ